MIIQTTSGGTATYSLTVNHGSGSGNYAAGTTVNIVAATAPSGQVFDRWTGDVANVVNVNAASTSIVMPAGNAMVTATYQTSSSGGTGGTFSFLPVEDAYLQGTTRFNDAHLKVEAGYRVSYLKFNVSGLSGTVQSATLRLQENGDVGRGTLRVHRGSHNNWTETTLSTANAPAENGQVGTFTGAVTSAQVVSMDVTPLVTGNGTYSVIVKMDAGGNDVWFGSAESSRRPQLIIQTTSGGTQTVAGAFPPQLEVAWDPTAGKWQLIWPGSNWVLQEAMGLESAWTDVHPPASSPYPVATGDDHRFFRLREADQ